MKQTKEDVRDTVHMVLGDLMTLNSEELRYLSKALANDAVEEIERSRFRARTLNSMATLASVIARHKEEGR